MKTVRVALAQVAPRLGDWNGNLRMHADAIADAARRKADVVVFPELSLTGYLLADQVPELAVAPGSPEIRKLATFSKKVDVVAGFVEEGPDHRFHNAAAYFSKGRAVHAHRKVYLPTYGMFEEGREFAAGDRIRSFDSRFGPAGILVCEDAWHPTNAWLLAHQGAQIVYVPANGPTRGARGRRGVTSVGVWSDLLTVTAEFLTSYVVFVNRVGGEDGLVFGGGSRVIDPFGKTVVALPPIEEGLAVAELDAEVVRRARTAYPLLRDDDLELVGRELARIRTLRFDLPEAPGQAPERKHRRSGSASQ